MLTLATEPSELVVGLADADALELSLERARLRGSLYEFLRAAWAIIEPSQPFTPNWHIHVLCDYLQALETENWTKMPRRDPSADRHVINIPPGTLKSLIVSVVFPAWVWARRPKARFVCASYGSQLSIRDNLRVRDIIASPWFQLYFPLQLVDDQNTKTRFNTNAGGWRIATSVDGVGTGEHPDYFLVDDPLTAAQAASEADRERANNWLDRTVSTRGWTRKVTLVVVMQRFHPDDCAGHLLKQGNVEHLCFPMRYEVSRPKTEEDPDGYIADPRDPRTVPGELLIPQLIDDAKLRRLELTLGPHDAAAQLQQNPNIKGGDLFKRSWFKVMDVVPRARVVRSARGWDTAATAGGGDYTVGVKISELDTGEFVVEDVVREQLGPAGVDALILATAKADGKSCPVREEKEGGSAGKTVVDARAKHLAGFNYQPVQIGGSKVVRAKPLRSQAEAGNLYIKRADWNETYVKELCDFPTGAHDDQVDGSSCAFNSVLLEPKVKKLESSSW